MLTTKGESLSGHLKNPFSGGQLIYSDVNSFTQYKNSLESNLQLLKRRFPQQDSNKIKDLLHELDNNIGMITQILLEQHGKQTMICQKLTSKKLQLEEENKILKNAIVKLYKKLTLRQKQMQTIKISYEKIKKENDDLKFRSTLFLQNQFTKNRFDKQKDVF